MKPDVKKIIITNLPYLLFVWLFGKMGRLVMMIFFTSGFTAPSPFP